MVTDPILEFHQAYCETTGLQVKYTMAFYTDWYLFAREFEKRDLSVVVGYLRKLYREKPDIAKACLRLPKLIQDRAMFAAYLAEAKAEARKPSKTDRSEVLRASGRPPAVVDNVKTVGQVLASSKALEVLRAFKAEQGMKDSSEAGAARNPQAGTKTEPET